MPPAVNRPAPAGYIWIEEAAEKLGVGKSTLYKWRYKRCGPPGFKHAGRVMYRASAISEYLVAREAADSRSNPELSPLARKPEPQLGSRRRPAAA